MSTKKSFITIINLVCRAVAMAMSVAVIVLNIMNAASVETSLLLLGVGLFGLAIAALDKE